MDAFETLVGELLWQEGYWVRTSVKVNLTKAEKVAIGRPSSPRWELDIVAYSARQNLLRVIECKSYLDSRGVGAKSIIEPKAKHAGSYKLFTDDRLREVVFKRLEIQMEEMGACLPNPAVRLGLACGKVSSAKDYAELISHFEQRGWDLLDKIWLRSQMKKLAQASYENQTSSVVAKLLLRE